MKRRFFFSIMAVSLLSLMLCLGAGYFVILNHLDKIHSDELADRASLIASQIEYENQGGVDDSPVKLLERLDAKNLRVTLVDSDGKVLFDNREDPKTMKNHRDREEIKEARELGYGESTRYSSTMTEKYVYAAKRLENDRILRVSSSYETVLGLMDGMKLPFLGCFLIIALLSLYMAYALTRYILKPLNNLNLDDPRSVEDVLGKGGYDELSPLFRKIDSQKRDIAKKNHQLVRRQEEFNSITASMIDGMIILDRQNRLLSVNPAALRALGIDERSAGDLVGRNIIEVTRNEKILDGLIPEFSEEMHDTETISDSMTKAKTIKESTGSGDINSGNKCSGFRDFNKRNQIRHSKKIVTLGQRTYQIDISPIFAEASPSTMEESTKEWRGTVLFLFDITEKAEGELMRREFTANVSHELKTPLQSIYGSAELLNTGLVREEDKKQFVERIYNESRRMIQLVQDIIDLSKLDEDSGIIRNERVDLYEVARISAQSLENKASAGGIKISVINEKMNRDEAIISSDPTLVHEIVYNLVDNAVKYNKDGGTVSVVIEPTEEGRISLTVTDTGIGIEQKYMERIFERFFRVDKSHSREIGGTGLGLSIVKHAVHAIGADINVFSEVGVGTAMKVIFPAQCKTK